MDLILLHLKLTNFTSNTFDFFTTEQSLQLSIQLLFVSMWEYASRVFSNNIISECMQWRIQESDDV